MGLRIFWDLFGRNFSSTKISQILWKHLFILTHKEIFSLLQLLLALPKGKTKGFQEPFNWALPRSLQRRICPNSLLVFQPSLESFHGKKALVFHDDNPLECSPSPMLTSEKQPSLITHHSFGLLSIVPDMKFCVLSGIIIGLLSRIGQCFPLEPAHWFASKGITLSLSLHNWVQLWICICSKGFYEQMKSLSGLEGLT